MCTMLAAGCVYIAAQGIPEKLQAFYTFLEMHAAWRGRVVFVEVVRHKPRLFAYEKPLNREVRGSLSRQPIQSARQRPHYGPMVDADKRACGQSERAFR